MKILNILRTWFNRKKKTILFIFFTILGINFIAVIGLSLTIFGQIQSDKKIARVEKKLDETNKIVLGESTKWKGKKLDVSDFDAFTSVGDIRFDKKSYILSLGYSKFAYFLSKETLFEHSLIKTRFTPLTEASDYYIIIENVFQVIIGDGDRQAISLKSFAGGGVWCYEHPLNRPLDLPPRYYLKEEFPIGNSVIASIDVNAREIDGNKRSVKLDIKFTDENGKVYDTLNSENITWEFIVEHSPNDVARYGIGLIDPSVRHRPKVRFEYLIVEEKQQQSPTQN